MADSLVLTGTRQVTKHTGTEMLRTDAKRGGNTWQLPRWWVKGNGTVYVSCTVFKVVAGGETGYLAIEASGEGVNIKITHDGSFNFTFSGMNEVSRGALYDSSMALVEHYVFPRISGGQTMVVTPPNGADRPGTGASSETLTAVALSGDASADDGASKTYTAAKTGTASDVVYVLTSDVGGDTISDLEVTFNGGGDHTLTLTGTSSNAATSQTDTLVVAVSETLTAVTLSGDSTASDGASVTYTSAKTGTASDVVYVLTSDVAEDIINGLEVAFDGVADHTLTLTGTSANAGTSQTDTLVVTVS